jgi:nitrilase
VPRVAVIQRPPVFLDRAATLDRAVASLGEAAANGARLAVFPGGAGSRLSGVDMAAAAGAGHGPYRADSCAPPDELGEPRRRRALPAARGGAPPRADVVCGLHERDEALGGGTLYNTVVTIGADGALANRHRKLMPTNPERMVWGCGDASGLRTVPTACGRIGALICWESYMPLARYALYAQGLDVYVTPTYDSGERAVATMQHIAREGGCWVVSCGSAFQARDIPDAFPGKSELFRNPDEWINPGDSVVVAPGGKLVAGPAARRTRDPVRRDRPRARRRGAPQPGRRRPLRAARPLRPAVNARPQSVVELH